MPSFRAVLTGALLATALGACAVVEGLSQYHKEDCSQGCDDGGVDATGPGQDGGPAQDGGADAGDTSNADTGAVGVPDASDAGPGVPESGADSACGPLDSVDNCGACGTKCDKTTGTPSCTGATCTYTCIAGHSDCNTGAPDTDGCECATPGCCGSSCQTSHVDGVGQTYFDCSPPGTYTESTATSACAAYALSIGSSPSNCLGPLTCPGSSAPTICMTNNGGKCSDYCWQYSGVYADAGAGTVWDCNCPAHMIGSWK